MSRRQQLETIKIDLTVLQQELTGQEFEKWVSCSPPEDGKSTNKENWNQMTTKRKATTKKTTKPRAKRSTASTYERMVQEGHGPAIDKAYDEIAPPPPMAFMAGAILLALCIFSTAAIAYVAHDWWTQ